jgi:hypothetical protein
MIRYWLFPTCGDEGGNGFAAGDGWKRDELSGGD